MTISVDGITVECLGTLRGSTHYRASLPTKNLSSESRVLGSYITVSFVVNWSEQPKHARTIDVLRKALYTVQANAA